MQKGNERLETALEKIRRNKDLIEAAVDGVPLFGAIGSSTALNLANESSDVDFYLIIRSGLNYDPEIKIKRLYLSGMEFDFVCAPLNELVRECENYHAVNHRYPTRFYRNKQEEDKIRLTEDTERPDYKREMIMRIYMSGKILEFEPDSAKKNFKNLKKGCRMIDIWDSYFNRAYGNYFERIKDKDKVMLRKYLYTVSEITLCRLILERNEKPIMDFREMFSKPYCPYTDNEIIDTCNKLWKKNKSADAHKEKEYIPAIKNLNKWIEDQLEELLCELAKREDYLRSTYLSCQ